MLEQEQFDTYVRIALGRHDVEVDEIELRVLHTVEQTYGPARDALMAAHLGHVEPEFGIDPSRPPAGGSEPRP
jgi:hypothetical protein